MLDVLHDGETAVRTGLSEKVNFEVTLLRAVDQSRARAIDTVIKRISGLVAGLPQEAGQKKIESTPEPAPEKPKSKPETPPPAPESSSASLAPEPVSIEPAVGSSPSQSDEAGELPEDTRQILDELYKAEFHGLSEIDDSEWIGRDQLPKNGG